MIIVINNLRKKSQYKNLIRIHPRESAAHLSLFNTELGTRNLELPLSYYRHMDLPVQCPCEFFQGR